MGEEIVNFVRAKSEPKIIITLGKFFLFLAAIFISISSFKAAFILFNFWSLPLCVVSLFLSTWAHHAAAEEIHDAVHGKLFRDPIWNLRLALFYSSSTGVSFEKFRPSHLLHHRHFGTPNDPDYEKYAICPVGWIAWIRYFFINFTGGYAISRFLRKKRSIQSQTPAGESSSSHFKTVLWVQALLFLASLAAGIPLWYVAIWLFSLVTISYGITQFRTLLEHHYIPNEAKNDPSVKIGALYNLKGWFFSNFMAGQYGYNFHRTHHHYPSVPNFLLDEVGAYQNQMDQSKVFQVTYLQRIREVLLNSKSTNSIQDSSLIANDVPNKI